MLLERATSDQRGKWQERKSLLRKRDDFHQGFEAPKRKPQERPRDAIGSRRPWKIKNVKRVRRNPADGNAQACDWLSRAVGPKGPGGFSKASMC